MRISLPSTVLSLKTVIVDFIAPPLKEISMWLRQALKISSSVFKCLQCCHSVKKKQKQWIIQEYIAKIGAL